ncbi:hypothetical protein MJ1HA_1971 [Metallosphaera sedula]|nr:hypothetical protein MJ1HA_1971 [Metallosphaera sedula]
MKQVVDNDELVGPKGILDQKFIIDPWTISRKKA